MPKLIVKQETENSSWSQNYLKWLSITGFGALLLFVASMVVPDLVSSNASSSPSLSVDTASNAAAKSAYQLQQQQFSGLDKAYKSLAASGVDGYQQNLALHYQTGTILQHLDAMDAEIDQMGLADTELVALLERQQYLQDYWQAEQHFRQLRLVHFEQSHKVAEAEPAPVAISQADASTEYPTHPVAADSAVDIIEPAPTTSRFLATPPPGVELPAGFCTLEGPNACKPSADD